MTLSLSLAGYWAHPVFFFLHTPYILFIRFLNLVNLPLWVNFYNYTDSSGATSTVLLDQPTLFYDLNPQPGEPSSTG